jgi:serine/threonine-protein kinase PpkA
LLQEGKKTLYQKVLTHPGATLKKAPGADGESVPVPSFSVLYVYDRRTVDGKDWVEVGASTQGAPEGWLEGDKVTDWRQTLVLKFLERSGRNPTLFFKDSEALRNVITASDATSIAEKLLAQAVAGARGESVAPDFPVLAIEPLDSAVPQDAFYLLPMLSHTEVYLPAEDVTARQLQVTSINPGLSEASMIDEGGARAFKTAIVFVIDTTISMGPYIERTRQVVQRLYQAIEAANLMDKVSFGLVAYRNNIGKTPGLEYVVRTYATLQDGLDPERFLHLVKGVEPSKVSSHSYNEDAFAGIMTALDTMDWQGYGARIVFLITDAGPLRGNDPASQTRMNASEIQAAARDKQVKIFALHLKVPRWTQNHAYAEAQYRTLTADPNPLLSDLYVPVPAADVDDFGAKVERIATIFTELVRDVSAGKVAAPSPESRTSDPAVKARALGYAMYMDYLGRHRQTRAPELIKAWVVDRDLIHPKVEPFQICVLLTKFQLNDLQQGLKLIVDAAKGTRLHPKDFFEQLASAAALLSRDPSRLRERQFKNLYESGLLGEFLEGLPYRSHVLRLTLEQFLAWSFAEQQDFVDTLESKIKLYERFHNDTRNWVRFGSASPGDALYRVPLSTLP